MSAQQIPHLPVLYQEIITALEPKTGGRYIDCTLGAGGHAWGILKASSPDGVLLGFDLDPSAIELSSARLAEFAGRFTLCNQSYLTLPAVLKSLQWTGVDGIVIDFGVSSMQLDRAERGFSFKEDGPLDMRFNPHQGQSAADLVNTLDEEALARIIWEYGEEHHSRRIAAAICAARARQPLQTTRQLADLIVDTIGFHHQKGRTAIHPATRSFQAIRIAVNAELAAVAQVLPLAVSALNPGGRLAVISFHSLEDRLVKDYFHREGHDCICPPEQPICNCGHIASIIRITKKPTTASADEMQQNPRSRSAKLRIVEKR